jgi:tetratricopeptide (TPR) repeat protein
MKRFLALVVLLALPLSAAPEKWWEAYARGVKALHAKNYDEAVAALQKSIAEMPSETNSARAGRQTIVYIPHFWLGIAKVNLGDVDGALREWKTSEEQGAIARTEYYPRLRDYVARAQGERLRSAQKAASGAKDAADAALSRALSSQMEALSAGADRSDTYRAAQRKLQEALSQFNAAGTEIKSYDRAAETAARARELFAKATEDARKQKASRPLVAAKPPAPKPVVSQPQPQPPAPAVQPPPDTAAVAEPPKEEPKVEAAPAEITASSGEQKPLSLPPEPAPAVTTADAPVLRAEAAMVVPAPSGGAAASAREILVAAYRAFAIGDLAVSERTLSTLLTREPSGEAYLLRGCARFTRATLARDEAGLAQATSDFREALRRKPGLRLDKRVFSPKLVAFFDQVRNSS